MGFFTIKYCFKMDSGKERVFALHINEDNLELINDPPENPPPWSCLDFHQCPNCPLTVETHPYCPVSVRLINIVNRLDSLLSYEQIQLEVTTEDRVISQATSAQTGISSLLGLVIATSGCPHTAFFKPMARLHLPLANEDETLTRSVSMYLLGQYFLASDGYQIDLELKGLSEIYRNIHIVNTELAKRLRNATESDCAVNAIVVLDMYAVGIPHVINDSLEDIRDIFAPFFIEKKKSTE